METKAVVISQYHAALAMLRDAIASCPDSLWNGADAKNKFWHVAYHALFYTHLYLQPTEAEFTPWNKHRPEYNFLGTLPWPPHDRPTIGDPFTKEELLEYARFLEQEIEHCVDRLDLSAESGFNWLPFGKLELQFYNIRHAQHHAGELSARLFEGAGIELDWIGVGQAADRSGRQHPGIGI